VAITTTPLKTQLLIPNTKSINSYLPFIAYFDKTNPL